MKNNLETEERLGAYQRESNPQMSKMTCL